MLDPIAIHKDHGELPTGSERGVAVQVILIRVKRGSAANITAENAALRRIIARLHRACGIMLAAQKNEERQHGAVPSHAWEFQAVVNGVGDHVVLGIASDTPMAGVVSKYLL